MKQCIRPVLLLAALLTALCACSSPAAQLPPPDELFAEIVGAVELPDMTDLADEYLESALGLSPEDCDGAVYCLVTEGTDPDEIVIIRARDSDGADSIRTRLEERLAYRERAAQLYLTEHMPVIQAGVVRQDGLTLSLIISGRVDEILQVYDRYQ